MGEILVSVVIPVYNTERYVAETLKSVLDNEFDGYEVICVNDGSTDHSEEIITEISNEYENVIVVNQKNSGVSIARNVGIENSRGKYILFLDSDDKMAPTTLKDVYSCMEKNELDVLHFGGETFFESDDLAEKYDVFSHMYKKSGKYEEVCSGIELLHQIQEQNDYSVNMAVQAFRRDFINENGIRFYAGIIHEDNLFCFQSLFRAKRAFCITDTYFFRRIRQDSIMTSVKTYKNLLGYYIVYIQELHYLFDEKLDFEQQGYIMRVIHGIYANIKSMYVEISEEEREIFFDEVNKRSNFYRFFFKVNILPRIENEQKWENCRVELEKNKSVCNNLQGKLSSLENNNAELEQRIVENEKELDNLARTIEVGQKEIRERDELLDKQNQKIQKYTDEIRRLKDNISELKLREGEYKQSIRELKRSESSNRKEIKKLNTVVNEKEQRIFELENSYSYRFGRVVMYIPGKIKRLLQRIFTRP